MHTFEDLKKLIQNMSMTRIYKQVMLQSVLKRGGAASKDEIAGDILASDSFQRDHYRKKVVDRMPGKRLVRDGALVRDGDIYCLAPAFDKITENERIELISECQRQIEDHISKRGDTYRRRQNNPVSGSIQYQVKLRAGGRCELCGASHAETQLDVDHIIPRNNGGTNDISNLQMLCRSCNAQKRDDDDTDFRVVTASYNDRDNNCVFCQKEYGEDDLAFVLDDGYPVTKGHSLIVPRRHVSDYFSLHGAEKNAIDRLLQQRRLQLIKSDPTITGFNVGINIGGSAGQTVAHVHVHLIPRRDDDMDNPRGGVRGVIPDKRMY
jgi:ATP adenylyltransferase